MLAQMSMWTAGNMVMTLLVNAPLMCCIVTHHPCAATHGPYLTRHQPHAVTDVHVDSWHCGDNPAGECDLMCFVV